MSENYPYRPYATDVAYSSSFRKTSVGRRTFIFDVRRLLFLDIALTTSLGVKPQDFIGQTVVISMPMPMFCAVYRNKEAADKTTAILALVGIVNIPIFRLFKNLSIVGVPSTNLNDQNVWRIDDGSGDEIPAVFDDFRILCTIRLFIAR